MAGIPPGTHGVGGGIAGPLEPQRGRRAARSARTPAWAWIAIEESWWEARRVAAGGVGGLGAAAWRRGGAGARVGVLRPRGGGGGGHPQNHAIVQSPRA